MKKLRVFISSPGDVQQERLIAKKVIANLNRIYSQYVELETIMWEDLPLEATASFQDGIDYFLDKAPVDIAVFILWSRLGSKLGENFKKPDGTIYQSGTEYEFDMMYALWEQTKRPKIMVYVKDAEPQFSSGLNLGDIKEALEQRNLLQNFIEENFRDRETGTNYAYWQFDKQQTFEERLKTHLTRLIHEQIGENVQIKEWEGNPYVGLRSYEETEANIYCGRQSLIYDIAEHWIQQIDSFTQKPLIILGESGSGKSSLVKAGLIPYLRNMSTEKQTYQIQTMTPSEFRGNVYQGIVNKLLEAFPHLNNNPVETDLNRGIPIDYDFKYLQFALTNTPNDNVTVFFFDQFEELFNDSLVTEEEKKKALQLLHGLCLMPHLWLIISMRSDFYSKFAAFPEFGALKNEAYVVDVPNVSATDIAEIVEIPAKKANLTWEINDHGVSLSKRIIQEANELKDLPLIEFGLSELYSSKTGDKLTFAAYEEMGRLKGAVTKYANKCYESLTESEKKGFERILGAVITVSSQDENKYVRKTSLIKDIAKTEQQRTLIKKLTDAHLFVTGKDANGESAITIVHEMLFSSWDVIKNWIEKQKEFISKSDHYEKLARYWNEHCQSKKDLILNRSALLEAEYYMFHYEQNTTPLVHEYLNKSLTRQRKKGLVGYIFGFAGLLVAILSIVFVMTLGTTGDSDIDEYSGIGTMTWWDCFSFLIPIFILTSYSLYLRIVGKLQYRTIKSTIVVWAVVLIFVIIDTVIELYTGKIEWYGLSWPIIFIICGVSVIMDVNRRIQWKNHKYKPYLLADRFEAIKKIVLFISISAIVILTIALYTAVIYEKNERYENTLLITDELFDGLNNSSRSLSWNDQLYINERRIDYLVERWSNELIDNTPDQRERQMAACYYNLKEPILARLHLYPDDYWPDRCLYTCISMQLGSHTQLEYYLESLIDNNKVFELNSNWISVTHFVFIAEMLGRFDLAEKIYTLMEENNIAWDISEYVNYGHIKLMSGNVDSALYYYTLSSTKWKELNNEIKPEIIDKYILTSITNDFQIFQWLNVGSPQYIKTAMEKLIIPEREFYTSLNDTSFTRNFITKLEGIWALADSSIVMKFYPDIPLIQYKGFQQNKEFGRALTNYRISNLESHLYIEELDQENCYISSEDIIHLTDSIISIRIIDNGNESDKGKTRTYYRVKEDK